jgi:H+/Cl- antiporter ClcA
MPATIAAIWWIGTIAGIIDALVHPASAWAQADRNKAFWIILMLFLGLVAVLIYLLTIRPRFAGAADNPFRK